ncbi:MAG: beta-ketoacyl-[acyl-carrier-protein] synthase family protein [Planctomycetia bacterium]|nr:beta-ketoacyl-[acyl-carrier-protein] synthase family protein [Planctomycetia bacterium]
MSSIREVVITGLGVVSPIGIGVDAFWNSLLSGRSGVKPVAAFPTNGLPVHFGGEITDFDGKQYITPRKSLKVMSREIQFAVAAAGMATRHAALTPGAVDPERLGVIFGAELMHTPPEEIESAYRASAMDRRFDIRRWGEAAMREIFPLWMLKYLPNMPACHIGIAHDARGPNNSITLGEASSLMALAEAAHVIERGQADAMIAGGVGSWLSATAFVRSQQLDASQRNAAPEKACRPFDSDRDGRVHGEGAAAFVLETAASAAARHAPVLARFMGASSAFEPVTPSRPLRGDAIRRVLCGALAAARWDSKELGHLNAHGASTRSGDAMEADAIRATLGDLPVTAPSSYFGNLGPGGGAVELLATILAFQHDLVPTTLNFERPDPSCPVNVVADQPLIGAAARAVTLNYARTGQAVAIALAGSSH